jgi:hypothetical protein
MNPRDSKKPEGKKDTTAPKAKKGRVINRGHNPSRTYFSNAATMASVDKGSHNPHHRGDAGWGVAKREPRFAIFRYEYGTDKNGTKKLMLLAVLRDAVVSRKQQEAFQVDSDGRSARAAEAPKEGK